MHDSGGWWNLRSKKKRRIGKKSAGKPSKLYVFFAHVTQFHSKANHKRAFIAQRPEHVVGLVETHLSKADSEREYKELTQAGWKVSYSPASPAEDSNGNQGGAWLMHKPWLQSAVPIEAEGDAGQQLLEGDIAWKHVRLHGIHIVLAFVYMDHSIGMTGENLCKMHKLNELTDGGRRKLIVVGDFILLKFRQK